MVNLSLSDVAKILFVHLNSKNAALKQPPKVSPVIIANSITLAHAAVICKKNYGQNGAFLHICALSLFHKDLLVTTILNAGICSVSQRCAKNYLSKIDRMNIILAL